MNDFGQSLLSGWEIRSCSLYLLCVFVACGAIRLLLTLLAVWEFHWESTGERTLHGFWVRYWRRLGGVRRTEGETSPDYWLATLLGFFELLVFPILMFVGAWPAIGAWFTLKTVAQWDAWKTNRNAFNRFLVGNAMVLIVAYSLAHYFLTKR